MRYLLMISLLLPSLASAEEQRLGFVAGPTYGVGIGYSKQSDKGYGWQVSALPIIEEDLEATIFLGAALFRTVNATTWGRAYWSFGAASFYSRQTVQDWDHEEPRLEEGVVLSFGPGVGLERRWKQISISLELPLAVQVGYNNHQFGFLGLHPIPNFSLMYYW